MNKQKLKNRQQSSKKKKIRKKESLDSEGIRTRRKGDKPELDINIFYYIKALLLVLMLISYFVFSTALLPLFIGYTSLYYFSYWVERKINRNFNSENKKSLFKVDYALAFITIVVAISSTIYSFGTMVGNKMKSFNMYFYRIMSLSTGVRNSKGKQFGMGERPEGFTKPSGGGGGFSGDSSSRPPRPDFDLNDLPVEFAFNQILSSVIQFLIFGVIIIGSITVVWYFYNKYRTKKIKIKQNNKNEWSFSKEDLIKLLSEDI